jgi:AcrR family transcriptional regulator
MLVLAQRAPPASSLHPETLDPAHLMASPSTSTRRRKAPPRGTGSYDRSLSAEERFADRHERLLDVSADVFARHGFSGASLNEIVSRAGVSKRTFYAHFDDMKACLLAVYEHAVSSLSVADRIESIEDPILQLQVGVREYLGLMGRNAALLQVFTREVSEVGAEFRKKRQDAYDRWARLITTGARQLKERGLTTREPDELTAYALVAAIEAVALRYIDRRQVDCIDEAAPVLAELVLRAFR